MALCGLAAFSKKLRRSACEHSLNSRCTTAASRWSLSAIAPIPPGSVAQISSQFEMRFDRKSCSKKIHYDKVKPVVLWQDLLVSCWGDQKTCFTVSTKQLTEVRGFFQQLGVFADVVILAEKPFFSGMPLGSVIAQITDLRCDRSFVYYRRTIKRGQLHTTLRCCHAASF